jgi:diacylglycerol kinase (ATP)
MKRKVIFIVNPISGTADKKGLPSLIATTMQRAGLDYQIVDSVADGNYRHLLPLIRAGVTDVVACGGDGTVSALAASLGGENVNLGIIPLGSGNGLARTAGIGMQPQQALDVVVKGNSTWIDGFTINDRFSCMLSGIGFDAQVAHHFARRTRRGLVSYTQETISQYFRAAFYPFTISGAGFHFSTDAFFISIANSNQFGNNFTIAPQASLTDGLLDIVIVPKMNKVQLLFAVFQQLQGNNQLLEITGAISKKGIIYFQAPQLQISNHHQAPLHIDGDPVQTADAFNIRIVPKAFRLLVP